MGEITLIQDLAVVMAVAAVITLLCHRLHVPVVLGYIIAGMIIGPHTPPYSLVKDVHSIHILSELGVVFLLFSIGLEFSLSRLMRVGAVAFMAATLEILFMMTLGYFLGKAFGWGFMDRLFLGAILSISSTTIIAKVLIETKRIGEKFAQVILGILIIEDLLAIVIIAVLSGLAGSGTVELQTILETSARVVIFTFVFLLAGFLIIPRLLRVLDKIDLSETRIISVLGLCCLGALAAVKAGFSVALGAFLVGAIIAETRQIKTVIHQMEPIRDMFTAVFFVAVGMMIKPMVIGQYWLPIFILVAVTILGKVFSCTFATFLSGYSKETSLMVGLGLAQIGEFSFIIANLGESKQVTSGFLYPITVSVSAITTLTTPFLMRSNDNIIRGMKKITPDFLEAFLGFYTGWVRGLQEKGKSRREFFGQLFKAGKVQAKIEKVISEIIRPETAEKNVHDDLVKLIREEYPWEVEIGDFLIPFHDTALNQRLTDLRLRSETGATIVGIYRDEESILNPSADMKLAPGDVLLILGSEAQVKAAMVLLQQKAKETLVEDLQRTGVPKTQPFHVAPAFNCIGKSIEEIKLKRRFGTTVLGIQKGNEVVHNPSGGLVIDEGDTLMLFGWPDQIEAASRFLSSPR